MQLNGRRVVITGASRGIGEAIVRRLVPTGAQLALVARQESPLKALAADVGGVAYPADLADADEVAGLMARIEADGPVDGLINNAGVDNGGGFLDLGAEAVRQTFQVNLLTPVELCRQVLPGMVARGRGHIVNVSSLAGAGVLPGLVPYSSTKAGLTHFTSGLRADLKGLPIGVTVVELGPIPTDMLAHVDAYRPTERSFRRFYRLQLLVDIPREKVAADVVAAIERNRRYVRLPKRAAAFPILAELPRRATELILTGVKPRA